MPPASCACSSADALRRPPLLAQVLDACEADYRGRTGFADRPYPQRERVLRALDAALTVDGGAVAAQVRDEGPRRGEQIAQAMHQARIAAVTAELG